MCSGGVQGVNNNMSEAAAPKTRVGVLALQGSFREHMTLLKRIPGVEAIEVRTKDELDSCAGLIIPGTCRHRYCCSRRCC
jgi:hypothetical protein